MIREIYNRYPRNRSRGERDRDKQTDKEGFDIKVSLTRLVVLVGMTLVILCTGVYESPRGLLACHSHLVDWWAVKTYTNTALLLLCSKCTCTY